MEVSGQLHAGGAGGTHWIGGRVGPRAGPDVVAWCPCRQ